MVGQRNQLAIVKAGADETGVTVAPLLAVRDDVRSGAFLRGDGQPDGVIRGGLEFRFGKPSLQPRVDGLNHPTRARPSETP